MKKNIVKMVLTTALVATAIIGSNKLEAKAMTIEEFSQFTGVPVEVITSDPAMVAMYEDVKNEDASVWLNGAEPTAQVATAPVATTPTTAAGVAVSHQEMLALVNADRTANGAGNLAWNADLEVYLQTRVVEVMGNMHSTEMINSIAAGNPSDKIAHRNMRNCTGENVIWVSDSYSETAEVANADWISCVHHHAIRTKVEHTQYACASYIDPATGEMVWVELFK